jgi:hypothetical protein
MSNITALGKVLHTVILFLPTEIWILVTRPGFPAYVRESSVAASLFVDYFARARFRPSWLTLKPLPEPRPACLHFAERSEHSLR